MDDIKYEYVTDIKNKKSTARGAKHRNIKHRGCKLPHDNLTKKEWKAMNGPVTGIDMSRRYTWKELKAYDPCEIVDYINNLVRRFGCNAVDISIVLDVSRAGYFPIKRSLKEKTGLEILNGNRAGVRGMGKSIILAFADFVNPGEVTDNVVDEDTVLKPDPDNFDEGPDELKVLEQSWSPTPSEIIIRYSHLDSMENDIINEVKKRIAAEMYELLSKLEKHEEVAITISLSKNIKIF